MRRSSIAFGQLATLPPPETCEDGLKIVCLVNPLIEALESFHEDLGEKMHSLSAEVEKLRLKSKLRNRCSFVWLLRTIPSTSEKFQELVKR